jgi:hypothetical protein
MIGGINPKQDIDIFLKNEEIEQLNSQTLEGVIIKIGEPKIQNSLKLTIDNKKSRLGIGVEEQADNYQVFLSQEYYEILKENGHVGTRYNSLGDKIDLVEESHAKEMDDFRFELRLLKTYVEHRGEL